MNEFAKLAQDFVEATSLLVGQRTINIMDQKGVIIASTEKHRIGDFHQGAAEVLETGKPVLIKKEDLYRMYPGGNGRNVKKDWDRAGGKPSAFCLV